MADQTPPNDPLDNRLRATFTAERDDIERRHLAGGATPARSRSLKWIPFAVAAALIAIAGFAFIGNRSNDQAVELDVAGQPVDSQVPDDQATGTLPQGDDAVEFLSGRNLCADSYNQGFSSVLGPTAVFATPAPPGLTSETRILNGQELVEFAGGCVIDNATKWYEIVGATGQPNDWIRSEFLVTEREAAQFMAGQRAAGLEGEPAEREQESAFEPTQIIPTPSECDITNTLDGPHFVWDVGIGDPDGGLIAHTVTGVNEPITRTIRFDDIVTPTGRCVLAPNGAPWYELSNPGRSADWVNAQYLRASEPACLRGEQFGTRTRNGQQVHVVAAGDRMESIAIGYGIAVEELLSANPHIEPNAAVDGTPVSIPGIREVRDPINGVFDGWAVADGDMVAFSIDGAAYHWYLAEEISVGSQCFPLPGGADSLEALRCLRVAAPVTDSGRDPLEYLRWHAGAISSSADHIHDIRTEANEQCTRVVVTFGDHANEDGLDAASTTLPPIVVNQGLDFVTVSPNGWAMESAFMDTDRVDYPGGIGLLTLSPGFEFAVELMHSEMEPNVRFFDNPARVVIDLFPIDDPDPAVAGPFGERFVLRQPIQIDPTGQGIPVDNDIVVEGFGRPFEAAGLYRIWAVSDDVDPNAFLADPPAPLIEEFFSTSGSAEGWGRFFVALPDLEPGSYIAVFGELPPTDEIGFYGTGQLFRVTDASTEEPGSWPEAVLLPNVQLPPE